MPARDETIERNKAASPRVHTVWVDCSVDEAFRLFTEGFAEWWPMQVHSIHKENAERCVLEPWVEGRIFERGRDGTEEEWGTIIAWDPPGRLEFTWFPGRAEDRRETVEVGFRVEADGTRVTLVHQAWERVGEPLCGVAWNAVLTVCFAGAARGQLVG